MKITSALIGLGLLCCASQGHAAPIGLPTPGRMLIEQYEGTETRAFPGGGAIFVPPGFITDHDIVGDIHSGHLDLDDNEVIVHAISRITVSISDPPVAIQGNSDPPAAVPEPNALGLVCTFLILFWIVRTFQRS